MCAHPTAGHRRTWFHPYAGLSDIQEDRAFSAVNVDVLEDESHTRKRRVLRWGGGGVRALLL